MSDVVIFVRRKTYTRDDGTHCDCLFDKSKVVLGGLIERKV